MTTRSQKGKAVEELLSGEFESSYVKNSNNIGTEQHLETSSKSPKLQNENLDDLKTSLRKETIS